jgi:formate dehydrogenase gamma subunit
MPDATSRSADPAVGPVPTVGERVVLTEEERRLLAGLADLPRFDFLERIVHWTNAILFSILMATASVLYVPPVSAIVGRRELVKTIHVYAGLLLPFPVLLGIVWGRRFRDDLRRLNRWIADDMAWLRARQWKAGRSGGGVRLGKFNPGQKFNAAFTGGAIVLMLATGSIMRWYKPWPLRWRTGATFVHDWVAIALVVTITGHILFAIRDADSLRAMWRGGKISRAWARRHAPRWLEEIDAEEDQTASTERGS